MNYVFKVTTALAARFTVPLNRLTDKEVRKALLDKKTLNFIAESFCTQVCFVSYLGNTVVMIAILCIGSFMLFGCLLCLLAAKHNRYLHDSRHFFRSGLSYANGSRYYANSGQRRQNASRSNLFVQNKTVQIQIPLNIIVF